jgi:hypothetical protein
MSELAPPKQSHIDNNGNNPAHGFWRIVRILRWALIPYLIVVALCGFFTIILVGYGLAHGSEESNAKFFVLLLSVMAAVAIPPFALLLKSHALWVRALQLIGMAVLIVVLFVFVRFVFHLFVEPAMWARRFDTVVKPITIESVNEAPHMLGGTQIGLRVTANVRLPESVPLDRNGDAVLKALNHSMHLAVPELKGGNRSAPFESTAPGYIPVLFNGKPLDDLPGMKAYNEHPYYGDGSTVPDGHVILPAGLYQVTRVFWLNGLRETNPDQRSKDENAAPCKIEYPKNTYLEYWEPHLVTTTNAQLTVNIGERISLGGRRGYRGFNRSAPLKYRYDHAQWKAALAALPLKSCAVWDEAKQVIKATEEKAQAEIEFARASVTNANKALHDEVCRGAADKVAARMIAEKPADGPWMPNFPLAEIVMDCTITKPQPEIFKQLAPAFYARPEGTAYCTMLEKLHGERNIAYLQTLAQLKLPVDCLDKEAWRGGLEPLIAAANPKRVEGQPKPVPDATKIADAVQWLKQLKALKIDVCTQRVSDRDEVNNVVEKFKGKTLLDEVIRRGNPLLIEALLDAGCNPHVQLNSSSARSTLPEDFLPASVWWTFRRHRALTDEGTAPLDTVNADVLVKLDRVLAVRAASLNAAYSPADEAVLGVAHERVMTSAPTLLAALAKAGARLDAADGNGASWFYFVGNGMKWQDGYANVLDQLSDKQMKQLIAPKIIATGAPGQTMNALALPARNSADWGDPRPFRDYVCKRKLLDCR